MPILVKIDQEMRTRTDRQMHWLTQTDFIICPMLYAVAMGQIIMMMIMTIIRCFGITALLCWRGRCNDVTTTSSTTSRTEHVELDLLHGIVKGYSRYIGFVVPPSPTNDRICSAQAVLRFNQCNFPSFRFKIAVSSHLSRFYGSQYIGWYNTPIVRSSNASLFV